MRENDQSDCAIIESALAAINGMSLAQQSHATPGKGQRTGKTAALLDAEVIQDAGRGNIVVWDRRKLHGAKLAVGENFTIHEYGRVIAPQRLDIDIGR